MSIVRLKNKNNGVTYVYESTSYWDKEKAQARNSRVCIGKLDDESGEIIYNRRYLERQKNEYVSVPGPVPCWRRPHPFTASEHTRSLRSEYIHSARRSLSVQLNTQAGT